MCFVIAIRSRLLSSRSKDPSSTRISQWVKMDTTVVQYRCDNSCGGPLIWTLPATFVIRYSNARVPVHCSGGGKHQRECWAEADYKALITFYFFPPARFHNLFLKPSASTHLGQSKFSSSSIPTTVLSEAAHALSGIGSFLFASRKGTGLKPRPDEHPINQRSRKRNNLPLSLLSLHCFFLIPLFFFPLPTISH